MHILNSDAPFKRLFEDVEKGLYGGVQDLGYAGGDLLTSGIDAAIDTYLTEELTKAEVRTVVDDAIQKQLKKELPKVVKNELEKMLIKIQTNMIDQLTLLGANAFDTIYNNLVKLTRNKNFYEKLGKTETFNHRLVLLFFHFSCFF